MRNESKILLKQNEIQSKLKSIVENSSISKNRELLLDLLSRILETNYKKRISVSECLIHDYFRESK